MTTTTFREGFFSDVLKPIIDKLPKPTGGSEKQNAWAEQIQYESFMMFASRLSGNEDHPQAGEFLAKLERLFSAQSDAKWWIDNRGLSVVELGQKLGW